MNYFLKYLLKSNQLIYICLYKKDMFHIYKYWFFYNYFFKNIDNLNILYIFIR